MKPTSKKSIQYKDLLNQDTELTIWLDLSTYCNASCPQCHRTDINGLGKASWLPLIKWSIDDFKKKFTKQSLKSITQFEICGTWGDPAMSKDLVKICKYIVDNSKAVISINTNGGIRTTKWWEDLGKFCGERLTVFFCIDGINNEMHQKYRRGVDLQTTLDNMEALASTEAEARSFVVLFKHNQHYIDDIKSLAEMYGATRHHVIKSDRFLTNNIFKFTNAEGKEETLEEVDINVDQKIRNNWINSASDNLMGIQGKTDKTTYVPSKQREVDR